MAEQQPTSTAEHLAFERGYDLALDLAREVVRNTSGGQDAERAIVELSSKPVPEQPR